MNRKDMRPATPLLIIALLFFAAACGGTETAEEATTEEATEEMATETMGGNTLVAVASDDANFSTLVAALERTGLDETLAGSGPFTVFAPTDAAFAKLPAGTLEGLSDEELTNILTYHVVSGRMPAADVTGMAALPTAQGADLTVTVAEDGTVKVNDATVVTADVEADNGVIHVIDTVLMPPAETEM